MVPVVITDLEHASYLQGRSVGQLLASKAWNRRHLGGQGPMRARAVEVVDMSASLPPGWPLSEPMGAVPVNDPALPAGWAAQPK
ncbi:hypothetical protein [Streptomyces sp. NPDC051001]|uniref:hypothetical protein n=1 Tax=Streptomyces sp. NPDC051001 TaxID=3155795 RepID=UPI00342472CA